MVSNVIASRGFSIACSHCSLLWCENGIVNKLAERLCHIINPYLFTKFHTSKHLGKRVGQTCMFAFFFFCGTKMVLFTNKLSEHSCHIINPYPFTKLHKHAHSHCSLLWCEKGTVYQQVIRMLVSLIPTCLQSFIRQSI